MTRRKRLHGQGSKPRKRGNLWYVNIMVEGRSKTVSGSTPLAAEDAARKYRIDFGHLDAEASDLTVGEAADLTLAEYRASGVREQSALRKVYDHKRVVDDPIAKVKVARLTRRRVVKWKIDRLKKGDSPDSVNRALSFLRRVLRDCVADGIVRYNVATDVDPVKVDAEVKAKKKTNFFTPEELGRFLRFVEGERGPFWILPRLKVDAGSRLGETLGASLSRLDFETGRWTIDRQALYDSHTGVTRWGPLKTANSYRSPLLSRRTLELLEEYAEDVDGDILFPSTSGSLMNHSNFRSRFWARWIKGANVRALAPHSLRHTCCTNLIAARVPIPDVADRVGDTAQTIIKTYAHAFPSSEAGVCVEVDAFIARAEAA